MRRERSGRQPPPPAVTRERRVGAFESVRERGARSGLVGMWGGAWAFSGLGQVVSFLLFFFLFSLLLPSLFSFSPYILLL